MKAMKPILIGCGSIAALVVLGVVGLGIWLATLPESGVSLANDMAPYAVTYLEDHQILNDTESLIAYYDVTISMTGREAAILTDQRVIYHKDPQTTSIDLADVVDVHHRRETLIGDIFEIVPDEGLPIIIEIAPLNGGETFKNALERAVKVAQQP